MRVAATERWRVENGWGRERGGLEGEGKFSNLTKLKG